MRQPLGLIIAGLVVLVVDFRTRAPDFVPDPVGWLLVAVGAGVLGLRLVSGGAVVAAVLSLPEFHLAYRTRLIDPLTNHPVDLCPPPEACSERVVYEAVTGWQLALIAGSIAVSVAVVLLLLWSLRRRAVAAGDGAAGARLRLLACAVGLVWGVPQLVAIGAVLGDDPVAYDPIWNGGAAYVGLAGVVVMGWLVVELCFWVRRGWVVPDGVEQPSPWAELMVRDDQPGGF